MLELDGDRALFEGKIQGIVATCYVDERPLRGLAGLLDWRFQGLISRCLRAGAITGRAGECAYVPVTRHGNTFHVFIVGAGHLPDSGKRQPIPAETLIPLRKNLSSLRIGSIGFSKSDFGNPGEEYFNRHFKGITFSVVL